MAQTRCEEPDCTLTGPELAEEYDLITEDDLDGIREALQDDRLAEAVFKIMSNLDALKKATLDIAITGESSSRKSSFVNAIRGIGDKEEGSAKTVIVETTLAPTLYPHPGHPNVTLWDLPGIGTPDFCWDTYLNQACFGRYDFIIIASERLKARHAMLAKEICKAGKRFYFVCSKADLDLEASKRRKAFYDERQILEEIRANSVRGLAARGVEKLSVFLLSNFELDWYDFHLLQETLENELPRHQRRAYLLSLPNISCHILEKTTTTLKRQVWKLAAYSCAMATVPVPGLSMACDVGILVKALSMYCKSFSLDKKSLQKLAAKVNRPMAELKAAIKSPLDKEISVDLVIKLLTGAVGCKFMATKYAAIFIPVLG